MCNLWVQSGRNLSDSILEQAATKKIKLDSSSKRLCNACYNKVYQPDYDVAQDEAGPSRLDSISQGKAVLS